MKKFICLLLALGMIFSLCACGHEHTWVEATCTEPKTCSECGKTEGEPLGHEWKDATCNEPKTCARCGETDGDALGHEYTEWIIEKAATINSSGLESAKCSRCGAETTQTVPKVDVDELARNKAWSAAWGHVNNYYFFLDKSKVTNAGDSEVFSVTNRGDIYTVKGYIRYKVNNGKVEQHNYIVKFELTDEYGNLNCISTDVDGTSHNY